MRKKTFLLMCVMVVLLSGLSHNAYAEWYVRNPKWRILDSMGGQFYDGPPVIQALVPGTVGYVVKQGGAFFEKVKTGVDVSFLLMIENGYEGREGWVSNDPDMVMIRGLDDTGEDRTGFPPLPPRDGTIIRTDGAVITPGKVLIARDGTITALK